MTMILGLCGRAHAGKDTAGAWLVEHAAFVRMGLADPIKQMLLALDPVVTMTTLSSIVESDGWEYAKTVPEVRRLLQRMGTEAGRQVFGENVWINLLLSRAGEHELVVVTDVRYPNEAEIIRTVGGVVIRIERPGAERIAESAHPSEARVEECTVDAVVVNDGTPEELGAKILERWAVAAAERRLARLEERAEGR